MRYDQQYIDQLETLVAKLLPYYYKHYSIRGEVAPDLNIPGHIKPKKPLPALLSGDFRFLPRTGESQEPPIKS